MSLRDPFYHCYTIVIVIFRQHVGTQPPPHAEVALLNVTPSSVCWLHNSTFLVMHSPGLETKSIHGLIEYLNNLFIPARHKECGPNSAGSDCERSPALPLLPPTMPALAQAELSCRGDDFYALKSALHSGLLLFARGF